MNRQPLWVTAGAILAGTAALVALAALRGSTSAPTLAGAAVLGAAVVAVTVRRPALGCAVLVVGTSLTAGLGRGSVVPILRTSEALTLLVAIGVVFHRRARREPYCGFDLVVLAYALGTMLVPAGYLLVTRTPSGLDTWRTILGPLQFLVIYLIFSRAGLTRPEVREVLQLAMAASVVVGLVAMAQVADVPGVRAFIERFYPGGGEASHICALGPCRATSLLEHWSGLGAYAVLHYSLALALSIEGGFGPRSTRWLTVVMAVNAVTAFISGTQAAMVGLLIATAVLLAHRRRVPKHLLAMGAPMLFGIALFWNQIQARLVQQLFSGGSDIVNHPESLSVRERYWQEIFVPLLRDHIWFGTGSVIPADVPPRLVGFVDNQYLTLGFRAGLVGELLLAVLLGAVLVQGWRFRRSDDAMLRAVAFTAASFGLVLAVIGVTAEYLTFAGVAQAFWMLLGVTAAALISPAEGTEPVTYLGSTEPPGATRRRPSARSPALRGARERPASVWESAG